MYFTLGAGAGTTLADLSVGGVTVPGSSSSTPGQVIATTDSDGVASITVKSDKTANNNAYTVTASNNNVTVTGGTHTVTYKTAAATTFTTSGGTAQTVGGSVTLKGKVLDQWKQGFSTGGQATLTVTRGGGIGADITRGVDIQSDGTFETAVADATGNTTVHTDSFTWTVTGATGPGAASIYWVTSLNVAAVAFTGLGANGTFPVPPTYTPEVASPSATNAKQVTATIKDGGGLAVPYAPFTLTGTQGVYFLDNNGKATSSFTGSANSAGVITDGTNAYVRVVFTKSGKATLTLKSGVVTTTSGEFVVDPPLVTDDYDVKVHDAKGTPGANVTVVAGVKDAFGNGVPGVTVTLSSERPLRKLPDRLDSRHRRVRKGDCSRCHRCR